MRMWMVDPRYLCRSHLLGEHKELHMFVGCIQRGTSIAGYVRKGQVEVHNILSRHEELVEELLRRGYVHKTPIDPSFVPFQQGKVDIDFNYRDLVGRCLQCRERVNAHSKPL